MYTKFVKNFNLIFGKRFNIFFASVFILLGLFLLGCTVYSCYTIYDRNDNYNVQYVSFKDDKASYVMDGVDNEAEFVYDSKGNPLNPRDYNGTTLKMYCSNSDKYSCYYVLNEKDYRYVVRGTIFSFLIISLGVIFRKLYKIRNANYGSISPFKFMFVFIMLFGVYCFVNQVYNLVDYMRVNTKVNTLQALVYSKYDNKVFATYYVDTIKYSGIVDRKYSDDLLNQTIDITYNVNHPNLIHRKNTCNYFIMIGGLIIIFVSFPVVFMGEHIDGFIKEKERVLKKERYKRSKK